MKKFKQADFLVSVILIVGFTCLSLARQDLTFIVGYFTVGAWQGISMIGHARQHWFTQKKGARYVYHWISLVSIITMPLGSFFILLFAAPPMAIFYTWLCYDEVYVKMQRPLATLK